MEVDVVSCIERRWGLERSFVGEQLLRTETCGLAGNGLLSLIFSLSGRAEMIKEAMDVGSQDECQRTSALCHGRTVEHWRIRWYHRPPSPGVPTESDVEGRACTTEQLVSMLWTSKCYCRQF